MSHTPPLLGCSENRAPKLSIPPQAMLRLRGRLNVWCAFDCAFRWAGGYVHPGSNLPLPRGVYPLPPSSDHPRDNAKGRLDVRALYSNRRTPCQGQTGVPLMSHSGGPEVGRWEQETWGLLDPTPGRFLLPLRRAQISSTPVSVSIASCNPPSRRVQASDPL